MKRIFVLSLGIFVLTGNAVAATAEASLCEADETVVFSCPTGKGKFVAICASPALTAAEGYMQYRFGAPGKTPDLVYPKTRDHPRTHFLSGRMAFSGGGAAHLKFTNGEYTYVLFTGIGRGWEKEGVAVESAEKNEEEKIAYLPCQDKPIIGDEFAPEFARKIGIPKDPDYFYIPE